jgi:hypothetical protein
MPYACKSRKQGAALKENLRELKAWTSYLGVLWEGNLIVRESADERGVALRDRCPALWAPLESE